ncbi:MAG: hypothetical protein KAQ88_05110, partial [Hyphomicrobiaceae bacterium]|nr:hypothetical protein [Hyphomicrobiaceae bacterium]
EAAASRGGTIDAVGAPFGPPPVEQAARSATETAAALARQARVLPLAAPNLMRIRWRSPRPAP